MRSSRPSSRGWGGLFYKDEGALVEELRTSGADGATMLSLYQKGRRGLLEARGVAVEDFADDQLTSADDVFFFPNMVGPIYPGIAIVFRVQPATAPTPTAASRTPGSCTGRRKESRRSGPSAASSPTGPSGTGARSPTRITRTWSTCRSG